MLENLPGILAIIAIAAFLVAVAAALTGIFDSPPAESGRGVDLESIGMSDFGAYDALKADIADRRAAMVAPEVSENAGFHTAHSDTSATPRRFVELLLEARNGEVVSVGHISRETRLIIMDRPKGGQAKRAEVVVGELFDGPKIEVVSPSIEIVSR